MVKSKMPLLEPSDRYGVAVTWSEEDEAFIASIPELPGCMSDGATRLEAIANLADAQKAWFDACKAAGNPVPPPKMYRLPNADGIALSSLELKLLREAVSGRDIKSSDRREDKAKARLKKAGYLRFDRDFWRWVVTDAGRAGLRQYSDVNL